MITTDALRPLSETAEQAGVSYRQAQHWITRGYLQGTYLDRQGEPLEPGFGGSGFHLCLAPSEQVQLRWLARLSEAGLQPCERTAAIARRLAGGTRGVQLGDGLVLIHDIDESFSALPKMEPRR